MRKIALFLPLLPLLFAGTLHAQTWFTVVPAESASISVTLPAGTTYHFGTPLCPKGTPDLNGVPLPADAPQWQQVTVTKATTINPISQAGVDPFPFPFLCFGTVKKLDVLETATVQQIQVTTSGKVTTVGVPALPVTPPPVSPVDTVSFNMTLNYKGQTVNASCSATPVVKP